jgi:hypothetical protein
MKIANLTQHIPTDKQKADGVVHLPEKHEIIKTLLTFENIPTKEEMVDRAERLAKIVEEEGVFDAALIGGAPYFMSTLEKVLKEHGIKPLYSFSKRISIEKKEGDKIIKQNVFEHIGFIEV